MSAFASPLSALGAGDYNLITLGLRQQDSISRFWHYGFTLLRWLQPRGRWGGLSGTGTGSRASAEWLRKPSAKSECGGIIPQQRRKVKVATIRDGRGWGETGWSQTRACRKSGISAKCRLKSDALLFLQSFKAEEQTRTLKRNRTPFALNQKSGEIGVPTRETHC
ncbi:MAG: hypothetical protein H6Q31_1900 [Bacteroidetes bacterium]|nr:hypothetical protein [Bacteroidota bacterium]